MRITIHGGSQVKRKVVRELTRYVLNKLLDLKFTKNLYINYVFKKLENDCHALTVPAVSGRRPNIFVIAIANSVTGRELKEVIAHELTHVKQMRTGQLFMYSYKDIIEWEGRIYPVEINEGLEYFLSPWEIDAVGHEDGLVIHYKIHKHLKRYPRLCL